MVGRHLIIELKNVPFEKADSLSYWLQAIDYLNFLGQTRIEQVITKRFSPHGLTILALVSESHISIHTYPEILYTSLDYYSCGKKDLREIQDDIKNYFTNMDCKITAIARGDDLQYNGPVA